MKTILRKTVIAALLLGGVLQQASAGITTFTGDNGGQPTFLRPGDYGGPTPSFITGVSYQAFDVTVSESDWQYTFMTNCEYNCASFFYQGAFDPARPGQNLMAASADDGYQFTNIMVDMAPGQHYVYVVTGYYDWDTGGFSTTVGGKGDITVSAVPEPSAGLMLLGGLGLLGAMARRRPGRGG